MSMTKDLEIKTAELKALAADIEAGKDEALEAGKKLREEIEGLKTAIAKADEQTALLNIIKTGTKENGEPVQAKTLGEHFVKSIAGKDLGGAGSRVSVSAPEFKANTSPQTSPSDLAGASTVIDRNIVTGPRDKLVIRNLFSAEQIDGNALQYFVEGAREGDFAITAEGAQKPQIHYVDYTKETATLQKIAGIIKESDEMRDDLSFLASAINSRLLYDLNNKVQKQLVAWLIGTSGIQTGDIAVGNTEVFIADYILKAAADIEAESGFAADGIAINPAIWYLLQVGKNSVGNYYGGGYFGAQNTPNLWNIPVVVTPAVEGVVVGAFKAGGSILTKSGSGTRVEMTNSNDKDFENNLVTIRAEERLALVVRRPKAFKVITYSSYVACGASEKAAANTKYFTRDGIAGAYVYTLVDSSEFVVGTTDVSGYYKYAE